MHFKQSSSSSEDVVPVTNHGRCKRQGEFCDVTGGERALVGFDIESGVDVLDAFVRNHNFVHLFRIARPDVRLHENPAERQVDIPLKRVHVYL